MTSLQGILDSLAALDSVATIETVKPHVLCDLCLLICNKSVVIKTFITHGLTDTYEELCQRCKDSTDPDIFTFHTVLNHLVSYQKGCHLCTMLWLGFMPKDPERRREVINDRIATELAHGSSAILIVSSRGIYGRPELSIREIVGEHKSKFSLMGWLDKMPDAQWPYPSFPQQVLTHPTTESVAEMIKYWLEKCSQNHVNCQHYETYNSKSSRARPTRLVDISKPNQPFLHVFSKADVETPAYVTLSHRWPEGENMTKLKKGNLKTMQKHIQSNQLPRAFRDAIGVAASAGIKYIWIDCLCIIQNSPEDWAYEANQMASVYGNAEFNLVMNDDSDSDVMLAPRNPLAKHPCKVASAACSLYLQESGRVILSTQPAFSRGWIVQERLLSRRNVYFGVGEITWECFEGSATELYPFVSGPNFDQMDMFSVVLDFDHKAHLQRLLDALKEISASTTADDDDDDGSIREDPPDALLLFSRGWSRMVELYSRTQLTYSKDRLIAIAGLATMISQRCSLEYVAGMWPCTLPAGLLWLSGVESHEDSLERPPWRGAPTWSWASIDGPIRGYWAEYLDNETNSALSPEARMTATILGVDTKPAQNRVSSFGEVDEAKLHMVSILREIKHLDLEGDYWTDGKREFDSEEFVDKVYFAPDIIIPEGTGTLYFFVIYRGWSRHWYQGDLEFKEEGLMLARYRDGFVRVGYMRVYLRDQPESALPDLLWGDGKLERIILY